MACALHLQIVTHDMVVTHSLEMSHVGVAGIHAEIFNLFLRLQSCIRVCF